MAKIITTLLAFVVLAACCDKDFTRIGKFRGSEYWIGEVPLVPNGHFSGTCLSKFGKDTQGAFVNNNDEYDWLLSWLKANRNCTSCTNTYITNGKWDRVNEPAKTYLAITITGTTTAAQSFKNTIPNKYICEKKNTTIFPFYGYSTDY